MQTKQTDTSVASLNSMSSKPFKKKKKNEKKSGRDKHMLSHWCCQSIQNPSKCEFTSAFWSYFFRPSLSWEIHNNRQASSEGLLIFFFSGH